MAEPEYGSSAWKKISSEGMDFAKKLLIKDPAKRLSLKEILQHPWVTREVKDVRDARRNSMPGNAFTLYSQVRPDTADLVKETLKKKLNE